MKKKILISLIFVGLFIAILVSPVRAESGYVALNLKTDKEVVAPGDTFQLTIGIKAMDSNMKKDGLKTITIPLELGNPSAFELATGDASVDVVPLNEWGTMLTNLTSNIFSFLNMAGTKTEVDICTINLKVKSSATVDSHIIKAKDMVAGSTNIDVRPEDVSITIQVKNISVSDNSGYKIKDDKIKGLTPGQTVNDIKNNVNIIGGTVTVKDKNGKVLPDETKAATGQVIETPDGNYTIVVRGDINGDGEVGFLDVIEMQMAFVDLKTLQGAALEAADVNNDGQSLKPTDLVRIIEYQLNMRLTLDGDLVV